MMIIKILSGYNRVAYYNWLTEDDDKGQIK